MAEVMIRVTEDHRRLLEQTRALIWQRDCMSISPSHNIEEGEIAKKVYNCLGDLIATIDAAKTVLEQSAHGGLCNDTMQTLHPRYYVGRRPQE